MRRLAAAGREADAAADLARGAAAVLEQLGDDRVVDVVELFARHGESIRLTRRCDAKIVCSDARAAASDARHARASIAQTPAVLATGSADIAVLEAVQDRVLWLATSIVHHANRVRETPLGRQGRRPPGLVRVDGRRS